MKTFFGILTLVVMVAFGLVLVVGCCGSDKNHRDEGVRPRAFVPQHQQGPCPVVDIVAKVVDLVERERRPQPVCTQPASIQVIVVNQSQPYLQPQPQHPQVVYERPSAPPPPQVIYERPVPVVMMQREPRPQPVVVVRQPVGFQSYCGYEQYSQPYRYPPQFYRPYGR